jgi:hypothetical protein
MGRLAVRPVAAGWWRVEHRATGESLHVAGTVAHVLSVAARIHRHLVAGMAFEPAFWAALAEQA